MLSCSVGLLLYFAISYVSSLASLQQPQLLRHHRSLLPKSAFHHVTNLSIEISEIAGHINYDSMIRTIVSKLRNYYHDTYGDSEYNLTTIGHTVSGNKVQLSLALYTKSVLLEEDIAATQLFLEDYVSNPLYVVTLTNFNEGVQRGETKSLELEVLIPVALILFIIGFAAFWFWKWRRREIYGEGEVFFTKDYKKKQKKAIVTDPTGFATIEIKKKKRNKEKDDEDNKKAEKVNSDEERTDDVTSDAVDDDDDKKDDDEDEDDDDDDSDDDDESEHRSEHEEDDEKAEEIELSTTDKAGEDKKVEEDD